MVKTKIKSVRQLPTPSPSPSPTPNPGGGALNGWGISWNSAQTIAANKLNYLPNNDTNIYAHADLGIDNTGTVDVTSAIENAIATIQTLYTDGHTQGAVVAGTNQMLFFENGIYLVSDEIFGDSTILIKGESRNGVVFKLKNNSAGYGSAGTPKAVLRIGHGHHDTYKNFLSDFTIEIGAGNPGAVALAYTGHNNSGISNIRLRDPSNTALIGLSLGLHPLPIPTRIGGAANASPPINTLVAVGIHRCSDFLIEGFGTAIRAVDTMGAGQGFQSFTLTNPRDFGFWFDVSGALGLYNVDCTQNTTGAIGIHHQTSTGDRALTINQCNFAKTIASTTGAFAIRHVNTTNANTFGQFTTYVQDTTLSTNYNKGIMFGSTELRTTGTIATYYKAPTTFGGNSIAEVYSAAFTPQVQTAIAIPHDEIRYYSFPNSTDWASVVSNGSVTQIQAALDSGKPAVTLQGAQALLTAPINIPVSVRLFHPNRSGLKYADSNASTGDIPLINILGSPSDPPLEIRDLISADGTRSSGGIRHLIIKNTGGRTLILNGILATGLMLAGTPGICLINHAVLGGIIVGNGWKLYAQNLDIEQSNKQMILPSGLQTTGDCTARIYVGSNAQCFVNFIKSEAANDGFIADTGSTLAVWGHFHANTNSGKYYQNNGDARFSSVGCYITGGTPYNTFITAKRSSTTKTFASNPTNAVASRYVALAIERAT